MKKFRIIALLAALSSWSAAQETGALPEDRALFFASDRLAADAEESGIFKFDGTARTLPRCPLHPYRGTAVVRLTAKEPFGGFPAYLEIYPGPPHLTLRCLGAWPKNEKKEEDKTKLLCTLQVILRYRPDQNPAEEISASLALKPGEALHAVWTWSGVRHEHFSMVAGAASRAGLCAITRPGTSTNGSNPAASTQFISTKPIPRPSAAAFSPAPAI